VTHALAELEIYFEHAKLDTTNEPMWRVVYDIEGSAIEVRMAFVDEWLVLQSGPFGEPATLDFAHVLGLQGSVVAASAAMTDEGQVTAQSYVHRSEIRPSTLARSIVATVSLARGLRRSTRAPQ
jgi:hypothetical protein